MLISLDSRLNRRKRRFSLLWFCPKLNHTLRKHAIRWLLRLQCEFQHFMRDLLEIRNQGKLRFRFKSHSVIIKRCGKMKLFLSVFNFRSVKTILKSLLAQFFVAQELDISFLDKIAQKPLQRVIDNKLLYMEKIWVD